jgi:hypothetical protein
MYPNPIVTLESAESFALSQSDLVSYLIFGQQTFELTDDGRSYVQLAAQTLFPSAQTIAASQLRGVLGPLADVIQLRLGSTDPTLAGQKGGDAIREIFGTTRLGYEQQLSNNLFVSISTPLCQFNASSGEAESSDFDRIVNGLSGKLEFRLSQDASIKAGKEPSGLVCGRATTGRVIATPSQWGLSLFKTWRF